MDAVSDDYWRKGKREKTTRGHGGDCYLRRRERGARAEAGIRTFKADVGAVLDPLSSLAISSQATLE